MLTPGDLITSDDGLVLVVVANDDGDFTCVPHGPFTRWADNDPWQPTPGIRWQPPMFETAYGPRQSHGRVDASSLPWLLMLVADVHATAVVSVDCERGHHPEICSCDRWTVEFGGVFSDEVSIFEGLAARMGGTVEVVDRRQALSHELVTIRVEFFPRGAAAVAA